MSYQTTWTQSILHIPDARSKPFAVSAGASPDATATATETLDPGTVFDLRAGVVSQRVGDRALRMYAFNGSIPGPTLRVVQNSKVIVHFTNELDTHALLHWHGLRLSNLYDPLTQDDLHSTRLQVPPGGSFSYLLRFPDAGLYCYHHDVRDDCSPEHGLYGGIVVAPSDPGYWPPVHREIVLTLDELLTTCTDPNAGPEATETDTPWGYDRLILANGELAYNLQVSRGEVVRFYLANVANSRVFHLRIPGAQIKYIGADLGQVEHQILVDELALYPMQRAIVDVLLDQAGQCRLEHHAPDGVHVLGRIHVADQPAHPRLERLFYRLGSSDTWRMERERLLADWERPPDRTLLLTESASQSVSVERHSTTHSGLAHVAPLPRCPAPDERPWEMVDVGTGAVNDRIDWSFPLGYRIKIRLIHAAATSGMVQHPLHFHGQRLLILARNGTRPANLVWQDTLWFQAGETIDILLEAANPGLWMIHCHRCTYRERDMLFMLHIL